MMHERELGDIEVEIAELLVATSDNADVLVDARVPPVLKLLRERMKMDVVFVSTFREGQRVFTHIAQSEEKPTLTEGEGDPLESSWCQRVVDGRLPEFMADTAPYLASGQAPKVGIPVGTHLSTPIVLEDGSVYGTLCCFSFAQNDSVNADDLRKLRYTAKLVASQMQSAA